MERNCLLEKALAARRRFNFGQHLWSLAHHAALFGSIICSVVSAALIRGAVSDEWKIAASVLTTIAAALTGIATSGGFDRKWRSNRTSRSRVDALLIDLLDEKTDISWACQQLKLIILQHDGEIINSDDEVKFQGGEKPNAKSSTVEKSDEATQAQ